MNTGVMLMKGALTALMVIAVGLAIVLILLGPPIFLMKHCSDSWVAIIFTPIYWLTIAYCWNYVLWSASNRSIKKGRHSR